MYGVRFSVCKLKKATENSIQTCITAEKDKTETNGDLKRRGPLKTKRPRRFFAFTDILEKEGKQQ